MQMSQRTATGRKPKVLIVSQYYVPESGAPQNRWSALAEALVRMGHEVDVLTAMPNYPTGAIFKAYRGKVFCKERIGPVTVYRTWLYATPSKGLSRRMLNYLSFAVTALLFGFFFTRNVDVLIWESPPLFLGPFARALAVLKRAKCVMNVSDLWPESAVALGMVSKDGLATRMSEKLEEWLYRNSHAVTGQTEGIVESIRSRTPGLGVHLFPNGVDLAMFAPKAPEPELMARFELEGKFVVGYGGIMGFAQALEQVLHAAALLKDRDEIVFAFFGDGPVKQDLIAKAHEMDLPNVRFLPRQDREMMPQIAALWDVGLVPLADLPLFEGARPSKMFELMGMAKAMVFCGRGEGARIVSENRVGLVVPPEKPDALAEAIRHLHAHRDELAEYGRNARRLAEESFDRAKLAREVSDLFQAICIPSQR